MEIDKIKEIFPNCELSQIMPCTIPKKLQFHLLIDKNKDVRDKIIDSLLLKNFMLEKNDFEGVKESTALGVVKAKYMGADISAMTSGRVVVRGVDNEADAKKIMEKLAPLIKKSLV